MNHKKFFLILDTVLLVLGLFLCVHFFENNFSKSYNKLYNESVLEDSNLNEGETAEENVETSVN